MAGCETERKAKLVPVKGPIVYAFTAKWCAACQADKPKLAALRSRGFTVIEVDADKEPKWVKDFGVEYLPTYFVTRRNGSNQYEKYDSPDAIR